MARVMMAMRSTKPTLPRMADVATVPAVSMPGSSDRGKGRAVSKSAVVVVPFASAWQPLPVRRTENTRTVGIISSGSPAKPARPLTVAVATNT